MLENFITGLSFDPFGENAATIDRYGVCLISNVDTSNHGFHLQIGDGMSGNFEHIWFGYCLLCFALLFHVRVRVRVRILIFIS